MAPHLPNTPQAFIDHVQTSHDDKPETYRSIKQQIPDIDPMFEALKSKTDITVEDIESYILDQPTALNTFDTHVFSLIETMRNTSNAPNDQIAAEKKLRSLAAYIGKRNEVFMNSEQELHNLSDTVKPEGMSSEQEVQIDPLNVSGKIKEGFGAVFDGFKNAKNPADKAILLAGVGASLFLAYKIFFAKNGLSRTLRNLTGIVGGGYVLYMAYRVIDRSYMLTRGKPIASWSTEQPLRYSKEEWDEKMYEEQLQNTINKLKTEKHIDETFIEKMLNVTGNEDKRYVKGIMNFGTMNIREYLEAYERSSVTQEVSDADWPDYPLADSIDFPQHNLSPKERFLVMKEIGQTVGIIDSAGNVVANIDEDLLKQSLFYKILNHSS